MIFQLNKALSQAAMLIHRLGYSYDLHLLHADILRTVHEYILLWYWKIQANFSTLTVTVHAFIRVI